MPTLFLIKVSIKSYNFITDRPDSQAEYQLIAVCSRFDCLDYYLRVPRVYSH